MSRETKWNLNETPTLLNREFCSTVS
jgi:hypothetical protein